MPSPSEWILAPWRTARRQKAIRFALAQLAAEIVTARTALDDALSLLGNQATSGAAPLHTSSESLRSLLEAVAAARQRTSLGAGGAATGGPDLRSTIIGLGTHLAQLDLTPGVDPSAHALARHLLQKVAHLEGEAKRLQDELAATEPVSTFALGVGAAVVFLTAVLVLWSRFQWNMLMPIIGACAAVFIAAPVRPWVGVARIAAWFVSIVWLSELADSRWMLTHLAFPFKTLMGGLVLVALAASGAVALRRQGFSPRLPALALLAATTFGVFAEQVLFFSTGGWEPKDRTAYLEVCEERHSRRKCLCIVTAMQSANITHQMALKRHEDNDSVSLNAIDLIWLSCPD